MRWISALLLCTFSAFSDIWIPEKSNILFFQQVTYPVTADNISTFSQSDTIPDLSKAGLYLMRIPLQFDGNIENHDAVLIGPSSHSILVSINGVEIYHWGEFSNPVSMTNFGTTLLNLPELYLGENTLDIYIYSDGNVMPLPTIKTGTYQEMARAGGVQTILNLYLVQAIAGISLFAAILFFAYSAAVSFKEKDLLFFSLFGFSIFMGYIHFIMNSPVTNDLLWFKISRIGYVIAGYFLFRFASELTNTFTEKKWRYIFLSVMTPVFLFIALSNSQGVLQERFSIISLLYLIPSLIISFIILVKAQKSEKKTTSIFIITGYILFFITVFYDITHVILEMTPYFWATPFGYFAIISSSVFALALRYRKIYRNVLNYKSELIGLNTALTQANASLSTQAHERESFLKAIAHEFRTPLHGMSGLIQTLLNPENYTKKFQEKNNQLLSACFNRFELIVQNILDYEAFQSSKVEIASCPFSPDKIFQDIGSIIKNDLDVKQNSFNIVKPDGPLPKSLIGDSLRISLILKNLLQNAIRFTENGHITLSASYFKGALHCSIEDTGCGIEEKTQEHLFEAFNRGEHLSFNQQYEGIGLGLAIVDAIVKKMQGKITFSSVVGSGTVFRFHIPMEESLIEEITFNKEHPILIVDDNRVNRVVSKLQLEHYGFNIVEAEDGEQALKAIKKHNPALIFMDVQMPVMNGLECTQEIRKTDKHIPIIGFTANATREECLTSGMNDVVLKPASADNMVEIIHHYI